MGAVKYTPLPAGRALKKVGIDLREARLRRRISSLDMAARLGVARETVRRLENGDPTVAAGTLATAIFILGLIDRLGDVADQAGDVIGLGLDRQALPKRIRKKSSP
jgi:transcriptional regulator with XRE-family HTH domain